MSELLISHIMGALLVISLKKKKKKHEVLFGKGTLVSYILNPCEFGMHTEVSIIIKGV